MVKIQTYPLYHNIVLKRKLLSGTEFKLEKLICNPRQTSSTHKRYELSCEHALS